MTPQDLTGYYTYRSFLNRPEPVDDFNAVKFAEADIFLHVDDDGTVTGSLSFPAQPDAPEKNFIDFEEGRVTSWAPFHLHFVGRGRAGSSIADFVYEYDCTATQEWDYSFPPQRLALTGTVRRNENHGSARKGVTASFVAVKRPFVPPREIEGANLIPEAIEMLASRSHRLRHTVWHTLRSDWFRRRQGSTQQILTDEDRAYISSLGWGLTDPPFTATGVLDVNNGAGEDFLFMHRRMIAMLKNIYVKQGKIPPASWARIPGPTPPHYNYIREGDEGSYVYRYQATNSGEMVPPAIDDAVEAFGEGNRFLKSRRFHTGFMRNFENWLRSPRLLAQLSLAAYGNILEFTIHNWMHMRWTEIPPRHEETGALITRSSYDVDPKWDIPSYDALSDFHSSHVNPIFWRLHGWVDDRIEDWHQAHEASTPGSVTRKVHKDIQWYAKGQWVVKDDPFDWPEQHHVHDHGSTAIVPSSQGLSSQASTSDHQHHHNSEEAEIEVMLNVMQRLREADARPLAVADQESGSLALRASNPQAVAVRRMAGFARTMLETGLLDLPQ